MAEATTRESDRFPPTLRRRPGQPGSAPGAAMQESLRDVRLVPLSAIYGVADSIIVRGMTEVGRRHAPLDSARPAADS